MKNQIEHYLTALGIDQRNQIAFAERYRNDIEGFIRRIEHHAHLTRDEEIQPPPVRRSMRCPPIDRHWKQAIARGLARKKA